jgi:hypothetical protein
MGDRLFSGVMELVNESGVVVEKFTFTHQTTEQIMQDGAVLLRLKVLPGGRVRYTYEDTL